MENDNIELSKTVRAVSRHTGALVGTAVVTGKKIGLCVKNMMTVEAGPSKQVAKKPVQVRAKKKKKGTGKKRREGEEAKIKRKAEKPKRSSRPRNHLTSKDEAKMSRDKSRKTNASTDSVS